MPSVTWNRGRFVWGEKWSRNIRNKKVADGARVPNGFQQPKNICHWPLEDIYFTKRTQVRQLSCQQAKQVKNVITQS